MFHGSKRWWADSVVVGRVHTWGLDMNDAMKLMGCLSLRTKIPGPWQFSVLLQYREHCSSATKSLLGN